MKISDNRILTTENRKESLRANEVSAAILYTTMGLLANIFKLLIINFSFESASLI